MANSIKILFAKSFLCIKIKISEGNFAKLGAKRKCEREERAWPLIYY
ncbi:hypothetical protein CHY_1859 [Carboxydothermus hydrogenoformans Z-2901]|uniref:Uncharacterized protein n=1 Tax=Carboxydothermus hydrogenoformans (strain ATCC BAA-161 / DSM 6008 / Z-2901) TaxID=246194 RepID=Q3AB05_CARHZ|nr:hypothetical protein CHY_1859 [Carboxydothermus hydrogenoformans Z-2901]